ncbi:hypothetical protein [Chitinophaga sp. Cy-1792]|uniref:XAC2610-related protein n=1 Tax=Chitinophaga sp. Cy-1792 TaxID=2608339 RepID=UPI001421808C|nr:hypothetical protein [Chitinophaga sp. Cy-1792]NIG52586.1 hypothetical protein [Chitinophaga sp. Cy-1792]
MKVAAVLLFAILFFACKHKNSPDATIRAVDTSLHATADTDEGMTDYHMVKSDLDSMFNLYSDSSKFDKDEMWYSMHIGHLFGNSKKYAAMHYFMNDSVSEVLILKQSGERWDTIFTLHRQESGPNFYSIFDFYTFSDFNGDGIPDFKLVKHYWDIHPGELSDLWLFKNDSFIPVKNFDEIISAEYDKKTKQIYSYRSDGCADMAMRFGVYKLVSDSIVQVEIVHCACCEGDSCQITIDDRKSYWVPMSKAYLHVPRFFSEDVKQKCSM